jgi:hypothetical protein
MNPTTREIWSLRSDIDEAYRQSNRTALLRHAHLVQEISTWRDGKVVWLSPKEVFASLGLDEFGRDADGRIEYPSSETKLVN